MWHGVIAPHLDAVEVMKDGSDKVVVQKSRYPSVGLPAARTCESTLHACVRVCAPLRLLGRPITPLGRREASAERIVIGAVRRVSGGWVCDARRRLLHDDVEADSAGAQGGGGGVGSHVRQEGDARAQSPHGECVLGVCMAERGDLA